MCSDVLVLTDLPRSRLETFAACLAKQTERRDVIALSGDLGAGKTVFARAFIRALTDENEDVPSPTFTLVQVYDAASLDGEEPLTLWHFDLYRLKSAQEIYEIGFEEALSDGVSLIEWPERAGRLLPKKRLDIQIQTSPEHTDRRTLTLTAGSTEWRKKIEKANLCLNALNS